MKRPLLSLAFALIISVVASAQDEKPSAALKPVGTARVYKAVAGRDLKLFVHHPADWKSPDARAAIVFFHGGGWEIGKGAPTPNKTQKAKMKAAATNP